MGSRSITPVLLVLLVLTCVFLPYIVTSTLLLSVSQEPIPPSIKDGYVVPQALLHKIKTWKDNDLTLVKRQLEKVLDGTQYVKPIIEFMMKKRGIYLHQLADELGISRTTMGSILDTFRSSGLIIPTYRGKQYPIVRGVAMCSVSHPHGGGRHQHVGGASSVKRGSSPGTKVGNIAPKKSGRK